MARKRIRQRSESAFTARVDWAAMNGDKTLSELAREYSLHGNLISQ